MVPAEFNTAGEQTAYKTGFADGFAAARTEQRTVTTHQTCSVASRLSQLRQPRFIEPRLLQLRTA